MQALFHSPHNNPNKIHNVTHCVGLKATVSRGHKHAGVDFDQLKQGEILKEALVLREGEESIGGRQLVDASLQDRQTQMRYVKEEAIGTL